MTISHSYYSLRAITPAFVLGIVHFWWPCDSDSHPKQSWISNFPRVSFRLIHWFDRSDLSAKIWYSSLLPMTSDVLLATLSCCSVLCSEMLILYSSPTMISLPSACLHSSSITWWKWPVLGIIILIFYQWPCILKCFSTLLWFWCHLFRFSWWLAMIFSFIPFFVLWVVNNALQFSLFRLRQTAIFFLYCSRYTPARHSRDFAN